MHAEHTKQVFGSHLLGVQGVTDTIHVLSRDSQDVLPALCKFRDLTEKKEPTSLTSADHTDLLLWHHKRVAESTVVEHQPCS